MPLAGRDAGLLLRLMMDGPTSLRIGQESTEILNFIAPSKILQDVTLTRIFSVFDKKIIKLGIVACYKEAGNTIGSLRTLKTENSLSNTPA